jgi:uncharacterized protein YgiM (DUF1202 family)
MDHKKALQILLLLAAAVLVGCEGVFDTPTPPETVTPAPGAGLVAIIRQATKTPAPMACQVSTGIPGGTLHFREGPGVRYQVLAYLDEGESLVLVDEPAGPWLHVTARGENGWVFGEYCEVKK